MQERYKLEMELKNYPDVVTTKELMIMLDGICENTALSLLRQDKIKHFRIGNQYRIPKVCVIDFMLSDEYAAFKKKVDCARHKKFQGTEEQGETPNEKDFNVSVRCKKQKDLFPALSETIVGIRRASNDPPGTTKYFYAAVHTNSPNRKVKYIVPTNFAVYSVKRLSGFLSQYTT